ncbi:MAG: hypothetical protein PUP92_24775 [Rhizonema sp. PD38]|nr:hypothetical protein [Rhizonema sp. PD38]
MSDDKTVPFSDFLKKSLGVSSAPYEAVLNYGYALLAIAGADGDVSETELKWLINHQRMVGAPEEIIEKYQTFEYKNADLENLLNKITVDVPTWSKSRSLLYHAIQMSRADQNYSLEEQLAVKKAAKLLKIENDIALAIHRLVETEEAVTALRKALLETEVLA